MGGRKTWHRARSGTRSPLLSPAPPPLHAPPCCLLLCRLSLLARERRAADVADRSAGLTSLHPNFGCIIARPQVETGARADSSWVVGEGFLYAQGMPCAELLAAREAGVHARGATAYLNLEPGDCSGDDTAVKSLVQVRCFSNFAINFLQLSYVSLRLTICFSKYQIN